MKLSLRDYDAMQSGWRKWLKEHLEIRCFKAWDTDFTGKNIPEHGLLWTLIVCPIAGQAAAGLNMLF